MTLPGHWQPDSGGIAGPLRAAFDHHQFVIIYIMRTCMVRDRRSTKTHCQDHEYLLTRAKNY